ncbi:MAG TPA: pantetheine-phosphate adenylyltransferase [Vicinamibacterales bacterium]|nr:pantetheine-phosphate adenylyltransferase [Vicinamibacterales bacterium]
MAGSPRIAIFPGSFDPLTNGHVDLIERATHLVDRVIVGVLKNPSKQPLFSVEDRVAMIREVFAGRPAVVADAFSGLLMDYARARQASVVIRGVRSGTDLDYESQMALTNRHLNPDVDTILLLPSAGVGHISSSLVREIASQGGSVRGLVPPAIESWIARRSSGARTQSV